MKSKPSRHAAIHILFLIALFGAFLISTLFIVLFGARIYNKIVNDTDQSFFSRTTLSYVTEKIRQHDEHGSVSIFRQDNPELSGLVLTQEINENQYHTYFYPYDGYLKEITVSEATSFNPAFGNNIVPISSFLVEKSNGLYHFVLTDNDSHPVEFYVTVRSNSQGGVQIE